MLNIKSLFISSVYPLHFHQLLFCPPKLLVHGILLQNHKLKRDGNIPLLLEVVVAKGFIMGRNAKRKHFCSVLSVLSLIRSCNTLICWTVTKLKLILNPFLIIADVFVVVILKIPSSDSCLFISLD